MIKKTLLVILPLLVFCSAQSQTLSVKDRWNIKLGYSLHKTFIYASKPVTIRDDDTGEMFKRKSNVRLELNYGVLKWLEVGGYIGLVNYEWLTEEIWRANDDFYPNYPDAFAPAFGVSANIQLLPLFVKNPKCKWDFYIPFRYGGCILFRHGGKYEVSQSTTPIWDNKRADTYEYIKMNPNKYKHEYGAGLGVAVYIKNIMGFYAEALGGQFSYWPELVRSPYSIRVGLTAKF